MSEEKKTFYEEFREYNAEQNGDIKFIVSKNNSRPPFKYLPWAKAWDQVLKIDAKAKYRVICNRDGELVHHVCTGGMVIVSCTICGETKEECYPLESAPCVSIPYEKITSTQVNKGIKRGLVKCLAQFGLGLNLYNGDDFTEAEKDSLEDDVKELVASAKTIDELVETYKEYTDLIKATPYLSGLFSARKKELSRTTKTNDK